MIQFNLWKNNKADCYRENISLFRERNDRVVISFVVCDLRFHESLNVIKSSLLFTSTPLYFIIFTDEKLIRNFSVILNEWKRKVGNDLEFELQMINFPEAHRDEWMNLFSKCAAQRLFIPVCI